MNDAIIQVNNLTKSFGAKKAVDGLSFDVYRGEVFALLGHNGAGKSTTIDLMLGLKTPDSGSARIFGMDASKHRKQVFERVGVQLQATNYQHAITVEEAIEEADYVIQLLDGRKLTGPVAYDWEMKDSTYRVYGTDPAVATACAKAFCDRIAQAGYEPMVYVSRYVGYFKFDLRELSGIPLWYPEYKYETTSPEKVCPQLYYRMDCWQYTNELKVDGIGGFVDGNLRFYW